jgi:hypothetical protein
MARFSFGVRVLGKFASSPEENMQKLLGAWLLCAAIVGCSGGDSGDDTPVDPFNGRWSCGETRTLTFATPPGMPDATAMSRFNVNSSVADGQLSLLTSIDAGVSCRLNFKSTGTSAELIAGQTCTTSDGITLTYKSGNASVGATGLHTSLVFDFAGALVISDGGAPLDATGSGTTASICSRIVSSGGGGVTGGGGW